MDTVSRSTIKYMDELEHELSSMPGYVIPESEETEKNLCKAIRIRNVAISTRQGRKDLDILQR